jgi:hypothetical protein
MLTLFLVIAAIGGAGVVAYQLLHRVKHAAEARARAGAGSRAAMWGLLALLAAIAMFALHAAAHMSPHVLNHAVRSYSAEP